MNFTGAKTAPSPIQEKKGGKVFVDKPKILEDVIISSIESNHPRKYRTEIIERKLPETTVEKNVYNPKSTLKQLGLMSDPSQPTPAQLAREKKDKMFPVVLDRVDKATRYLDNIEKEMKLFEEARNNKIRRQYEDWNTNVHGEIQKNIAKTINDMESKELNKKKNDDYDKFLSITNKKAAIFRDIIIESEYDPLEPNRRCVKAKTKKLKDPVDISAQKAEEEASMLQGGVVKSRKPLCKETLNVELWASGQIEATPYGTFAKIMEKARNTGFAENEGSNKSATLRSHIAFDHYTYPKGKAAIDAEMPKGKRIYPKVMYSDPSRIFGHLPPDAEREIALICPPENRLPTV